MAAPGPIDDFTVAERKLWWDILKRPFGDWQIVLRWALSSLAYEHVQNLPPAETERVAALRNDTDAQMLARAPLPLPEDAELPPGYSWDATLDGLVKALRAEGRLTADLAMLAEMLTDSAAANTVLWIWDVDSVQTFQSPLDLRREVCYQLQQEIAAAGDCSTWLSFMLWVVRRREAGYRESWREWSEKHGGSDALRAGIETFLLWRQSRRVAEAQLATGTAPGAADGPLKSAPPANGSAPSEG